MGIAEYFVAVFVQLLGFAFGLLRLLVNGPFPLF